MSDEVVDDLGACSEVVLALVGGNIGATMVDGTP